MYRFSRLIAFSLLVFAMAGCAGVPEDGPDSARFDAASYRDLPGWQGDHHAAALATFLKSCNKILALPPDRPIGPGGMAGQADTWATTCRLAGLLHDPDDLRARQFFEQNFSPWRVTSVQTGKTGLFTGYYEAGLRGSRTRHGPYQTALLKRPDDLVMVDLGLFRDNLRGQRIAGRVIDGSLKPFEDRTQIESGALADLGLEMVWVDDPIAAFFLHIQGSGVVTLDDGTVIRVGYAGQNGHPYYAIGRELVARGELEKQAVSLQSIRDWLKTNPEEAHAVMNTNASYVFFHELTGPGPLGAQGVPLTPVRSLAVDHTLIPYGAPLWLVTDPPAAGEGPLRRLMIAQDTGGAIRGAVRGDVFWGHGPRAEDLAGKMKAEGRYWLLLPHGVDPRGAHE